MPVKVFITLGLSVLFNHHFTSLSVCLSVCLSVNLYVCLFFLSVYLYVCLFFLSICLYVYFFCLCVCLSLHFPIFLSISLFRHTSLCSFIHLFNVLQSVCFSFSLFCQVTGTKLQGKNGNSYVREY
jgi:hypothetical protein